MTLDLKNPLQGVSITALVRLLVAVILVSGVLIVAATYWANTRVLKLNDTTTTYQVEIVDRLQMINVEARDVQNLILRMRMASLDPAALAAVSEQEVQRYHRAIHTALELIESEMGRLTELQSRFEVASMKQTMARANRQFERIHEILDVEGEHDSSDLSHPGTDDVGNLAILERQVASFLISMEQAGRLGSATLIEQHRVIGVLERSNTLQLFAIMTVLAIPGGYLVVQILRNINQGLEREARSLETLHKSEVSLSHAQSLANLGSYDCNILTGEVTWSEQAYRIMGLSPDEHEASAQDFLERIHTDDRPLFAAALIDAKQKGEAYDVVHRIVRPSGEVRILENQSEVGLDQDGRPIRLRGAIHDITELKRPEQELLAAKEAAERANNSLARKNRDLEAEMLSRQTAESLNRRFGRILEFSLNEIYIFDGESCLFVEVNQGARKNLGYSMDELRSLTAWNIKAEISESVFRDMIAPLCNGETEILRFETVHQRKDGSRYPVEVHLQRFAEETGFVFVAVILDITERKQAEKERDEAVDTLSDAVESISEGFAVWDRDDRLALWNTRYIEMFRPLSDMLTEGVYYEDFVRAAIERGLLDIGNVSIDEYVEASLASHRSPEEILERNFSDGRWLRISRHPTKSGGTVGIWTDVTEKRRAEDRIRELALHDSLTGLANRNQFQRAMKHELAEAKRHNRRIGLLFLDLDGFKRINDEMGHPAGDELLKVVAERLNHVTRETDTVARLGGDEFAVLMADVDNLDAPNHLSRRIIAGVSEPVVVDGKSLNVGTSIGVSLYPDDGTESDELIRKADLALYQAKAAGRGTFRMFDEDMHRAVVQRNTLESELRDALANGELELYYQPQLDVEGRSVIGAEALIRWNHPRRGMVSPGEFIPIAETSSLIEEIGKWTLSEICEQSNRWRSMGLPEICVAANVSARQFRSEDLVEHVSSLFERTDCKPSLLELEITESVVMDDAQFVVMQLARLSNLGLDLAIDDFGTGYSSLAYLKQFPVNRLKIDQTFVSGLTTDADNAAIVNAVVQLSHSLGLEVLAEGVETEDQLKVLRKLGCDAVQGYYFARPLPADEFAAWVLDRLKVKKREPVAETT